MNKKLIMLLMLVFLVMTVISGCKDKATEEKVVDILTSEEENVKTEEPNNEASENESKDTEDISQEVETELVVLDLSTDYYLKSTIYIEDDVFIEEKWTDGDNTRTSIGPPGSPETAESIITPDGLFVFIESKDGSWICPDCDTNFNQLFGDLQGGYPPGSIPPGPGWPTPNPGWGSPPPPNGWTNNPLIHGDPSTVWGNPPPNWGDYSQGDLILSEQTNSHNDTFRNWHVQDNPCPVRQEFNIGGNDVIRNNDLFNDTDPLPVDIFVAPSGVPNSK